MLKFCSPIPVPPFIVCYLSCLIWLALFSSLAIIFDLSSLSPPSLTFLLRSLLSPFAPHVERLPPPRPPPGSVISGRRKNEAVIGKWMSSANFPSAELTPAATGRRVGGGNNFRVSKGVCRQGPILLSLPLCLFTNFPQIICFRTPPPSPTIWTFRTRSASESERSCSRKSRVSRPKPWRATSSLSVERGIIAREKSKASHQGLVVPCCVIPALQLELDPLFILVLRGGLLPPLHAPARPSQAIQSTPSIVENVVQQLVFLLSCNMLYKELEIMYSQESYGIKLY